MGQALSKPVILIVEDEPLILLNAVEVAQDAGFEVLDAADADEALAVLERRDDICMIFTDVRMPGSMDGLTLAHAVRRRWPPIQLVVTSGHIRGEDLVLPEGGAFLPKPYDPARMATVLKTALYAASEPGSSRLTA